MAKQRKSKRVIIVNKYGPFSKAITGRSARELAEYLHKYGITATFCSVNTIYKNELTLNEEKENTFVVNEIRSIYNGDLKWLRLLSSLYDGFRLFRKSTREKGVPVIVMTDPPLLLFWFQLARKFISNPIIYWTMDLYPDAFVAAGLTNPNSFIHKWINKVTYKIPPDFTISLGERQQSFLNSKFSSNLTGTILPCGIVNKKRFQQQMTESIDLNQKYITFGYGGNLGEAHDAEFLRTLITKLNPERHRIILSIYGTKAESLLADIRDNPVVIKKDFLNYQDLNAIDVNIASLLAHWNHLCVPSKAVTAICCETSLLLNTTEDSEAWNMFQGASWLVPPRRNYDQAIDDFLENLTIEEIQLKRKKAKELAQEMIRDQEKAFLDVLTFCNN